MEINFEKLLYYLGGIALLLLIGVVYYIVKGKKDMEEAELKKKMEEEEEAKLHGGNIPGNGMYTLCPSDPGYVDGAPNIVICNEEGEIQTKINTVTPRVIFTSYPKTEQERVNLRRDAVIQMIIAEGAGVQDYQLSGGNASAQSS